MDKLKVLIAKTPTSYLINTIETNKVEVKKRTLIKPPKPESEIKKKEKKSQSQKKLVFVARELTLKDIVKHMRKSFNSIEKEVDDRAEVKRLQDIVEDADFKIKDLYWHYCQKLAIEKDRREKIKLSEQQSLLTGVAIEISDELTPEEAAKRAAHLSALSEALRKEQLIK